MKLTTRQRAHLYLASLGGLVFVLLSSKFRLLQANDVIGLAIIVLSVTSLIGGCVLAWSLAERAMMNFRNSPSRHSPLVRAAGVFGLLFHLLLIDFFAISLF